jgi:hypothetical protein
MLEWRTRVEFIFPLSVNRIVTGSFDCVSPTFAAFTPLRMTSRKAHQQPSVAFRVSKSGEGCWKEARLSGK